LANPILPGLYTAWYNGAPTTNQTNGQISGGIAVGNEGPNFDENNTRINEDIDKYIQFENRVLGVARLRQIRVK
jgi:aromatic ring hydroxylase